MRGNDLGENLCIAIDSGDIEKAKKLLSSGADPNYCNDLPIRLANIRGTYEGIFGKDKKRHQ
jgi:ankyrin repeat protein